MRRLHLSPNAVTKISPAVRASLCFSCRLCASPPRARWPPPPGIGIQIPNPECQKPATASSTLFVFLPRPLGRNLSYLAALLGPIHDPLLAHADEVALGIIQVQAGGKAEE